MKNGFALWSELRILLAVMRAGSTLAASRGLDIAQPTVARRIEALEQALGLVLFEKDTRGFHPTSAAQDLLPLAEEMEAAAGALCAKAEALRAPRAIRITVFNRNFSPRAMAIFDDFAELLPEVSFEFLPGVRSLDLLAGEADIALRLTRSPVEPDLICRKTSTAQFALYGSERNAEKYGLPRSVAEMPGHRFVSYLRPDVPPTFHDWLLRYVPEAKIVQTFTDVDLMDTAIASRRGLGIPNVRLAEATVGNLRCFDPPEEMNAEHLMLISPAAWRRSEVKDFVRFFAPRYAAIFR